MVTSEMIKNAAAIQRAIKALVIVKQSFPSKTRPKVVGQLSRS